MKKSTEIQLVNGKKYFIHKVEEKQTLFGIAKAYGTTVSEVAFENPEVVDGGVKVGQLLKIPVEPSLKPSTPVAQTPGSGSEGVGSHTVVQGETLYSISKQYGTTIELLKALNPELESGLKLGQVIKIPTEEKAVGSNGMVPVAPSQPITTSRIDKQDLSAPSVNFVSLLLPFYLKDYVFSDTIPFKVGANSVNALDFYQGAMLAIDSLKGRGLHYHVSVFDVVSDSVQTKQILKRKEVQQSHLIIGPFYNSTFETVAKFAKEQKIPLVSPMIQNSKILNGNPLVSKVVPNNSSQMESMADYLSKNYKDANLILVHNDHQTDLNLMNAFKNKMKLLLPEKNGWMKEVNYKSSGFTGISNVLLGGNKQNVVVVFSSDQVLVSQLLPKLDGKRDDYKLVVCGQAIWKNFDNIEADLFSKLNVHLPLNYFVDYQDLAVKRFIYKFREKYQSEPSQMAFLGYDITYYYLNALNNRGQNFHTTLWQIPGSGMSTGFDFFRDSSEKGFENKACSIVKFDNNQLVKVK
ncbi:MAG: LysM peptidoglycan-binding domain-containing protein [Bacteroidia bacterium]|nr:LysM peptidoglycan-binding domain-containing protein [Bacteroidia bacterium]